MYLIKFSIYLLVFQDTFFKIFLCTLYNNYSKNLNDSIDFPASLLRKV